MRGLLNHVDPMHCSTGLGYADQEPIQTREHVTLNILPRIMVKSKDGGRVIFINIHIMDYCDVCM